MTEPSLERMQHMRREYAERHHRKSAGAKEPRQPGERDDLGDDRGRRQHDADLKRRRRDLISMILRQEGIAALLRLLGAFGELLAAFMRLRLGIVARDGFLPSL